MLDARHEHQEPPREADVPGQPGPLAADGVLHHLHQDLLPLPHRGQGNGQHRKVQGPALPVILFGHLLGGQAVGLGLIQVEEAVLGPADGHERALHALQQLGHLPLVDIAHLAGLGGALNEQFA